MAYGPRSRLRLRRRLAREVAAVVVMLAGRASAEDDAKLASLSADAATTHDDLGSRLERARALVQRGDLAGAITLLDAAPPTLEVVLLRAKALLWSNAPEGARAVLEDAPEPIRQALDARIVLAEVFEAMGTLDAAKAQVDAVLAEAKDHADAQLIQRRVERRLLEQKRTSGLERVALLARARASVADPAAHGEAEATLLAQLQALPAEEHAEALARIRQNWPPEPARERLILEGARRWQDQAAAFESARALLDLDPTAEEVRQGLGDLACAAAWSLLGAKAPERAREVVLAVPVEARPACLWLAGGHSAMALAKFDEAGRSFDVLLQREPDNKDALISRAHAAMATNDLDAADRMISRLRALPDASADQVRELGVNRCIRAADRALQQHEPVDAELWATRALELEPRSVDAALLLSSSHQIQRRPEDAARVLTRALEHNPKSPRLLAALARVPGERDHVALAKQAIGLLKDEPADLEFDIRLGLGDALMLDRQFDDASREFDRMALEQPDNQAPKLRLAQVSMHEGNVFRAHDQLHAALAEQRSFGALLSLADASHALNLESDAFAYTHAALELQPDQPDARGLLDRLEFAHAPTASARIMHSWDNGLNQAWEYGAASSTDLSPDLRANADVSLRNVENSGTAEAASVVAIRLGLAHQWTRRVAVSGALGVAQFRSEYLDDRMAPWLMARTDLRVGPVHRLAFEYQSDTFSYTAGMMDDSLGLHTLSAISYGPLLPWVSYYANASVARLTDGNGRGLVFASLYSDLLTRPVVKTGINGQILGFSETSLRSYFSPSQLLNTEGFAEVFSDNVEDFWIYGALGAVGLQWIEDRKQQTTYRANARFGVRPWRALKLVAIGQLSSSATTNIAGFDYYELGLTTQVTFE